MLRTTRSQSRSLAGQTSSPSNEHAASVKHQSRPDPDPAKVPGLHKRQREISADFIDIDAAPEFKKARMNTAASEPRYTPANISARQPESGVTRLDMVTVMEKRDIDSLREFLQSTETTVGRRVFLLHQAVHNGWLEGIDTLAEFGTIKESLDMDLAAIRKGQPTLFQKAVSSQNSLVLGHLNVLAGPLREQRRNVIKAAIESAALKSDLPTLRHYCTIADMAELQWSSTEMSRFILIAVADTEPRSSNFVPGATVIAYLRSKYPHSIVPANFDAALLAATRLNKWQAASMLLGEYRADPDARDENGRTALMHAALKGRYDLYELLRFHDASLLVQDIDGKSVLHHAVDGGNEKIITELLVRGKIDTSLKDAQNRTAAAYASMLGQDAIVQLIKHGIYGPSEWTEL